MRLVIFKATKGPEDWPGNSLFLGSKTTKMMVS
jgi:hypothetical protein